MVFQMPTSKHNKYRLIEDTINNKELAGYKQVNNEKAV